MKNLNWILPLTFLSFLVSGCIIDIDSDNDCIDSDGPIVTEEFELSRMDGIELSISASVFITQGDEQKVEVEAQQEVIDLLDRSVRGGIWDINLDGCFKSSERVRIYITLPEWTSISLSGSGNIVSTNQLVVDDIDIDISGSGDIDLALDADDINSSISGSGNIELEGIADELDISVRGSGDYKCFGLEARKVSVSISGSGDAELLVTDILDVNITGSGDIFYKGSPQLSVSITGSGDVINSN